MKNSTINPIPKRLRATKRWAGSFNRNKYNARKVELGGRRYDSNAEGMHSLVLQDMLKNGEIKDLKYQVSYDLYGKNGAKVCEHRVDFQITHLDDSIEMHEVKGFETNEWRIKRNLFEDNYPEIKYTIIPAQDYYRR